MKKYFLVFIVIFSVCFIFSGCLTILKEVVCITGAGIMADYGKNATSQRKDNDLIAEYEIGESTVRLHITVYKNSPGYLFVARDYNKQILGSLFYHAAKEDDMKEYNEFLKMEQIEKEQFIHESFMKYAQIDLTPVKKVDAITSATPPTPVSSSLPPTTSFAPAYH
ncbi:hypothetical protein KKC83_02135 [Patescibacteria group bacterium]|nr:hypothetical protein [Candidatus Falkowbacteria bacterium]MBU3905547.1 hypothetical protein [Patescibacteria group bacterium]MBU4015370.1 hypothetical protein [Patescibacteria group bacterium]MBU4026324.1 hypothetical protein [Patescibacteria group bacterium]MBU4072808.1 hypothetical protein [Patescibacteria group bacterium]